MYEFWSYNKKIVLALRDEQFANTSINKEQKIYKVDDEVKRDAIQNDRDVIDHDTTTKKEKRVQIENTSL